MATVLSDVLQLHWDMKDGMVTVTPEDEDRFSIKVERAIEILQQGQRAEEFRRQFRILLRLVIKWLQDQKGIRTSYLTQRDGALAFIVVRSECEYDDDFEDALSGFDFQTANDPDVNLIRMDAITLPPASESAIRSFLDPEFTLEIGHGKRSESPCVGQ